MPARILIAEDNADARTMLGLVLRDHGFIVAEAPDGQAALRLIEQWRPDLIITDIEMPILDGIQMIKLLRSRPAARKVPILVMSANAGRGVTDALTAGADAAAHKPVQIEALIQLIKRLLVID